MTLSTQPWRGAMDSKSPIRAALVALSVSIYPFAPFIAATATPIHFSKALPVRWLELRETKGSVILQLGNQNPRSARRGDRLSQVSDRITTGAQSNAVLAVDEGTAIIRLSENTVVQVQKLYKDRSGGNITVLSVPKGMARLQVRPFTRPSSRLDIQTPAGVAGVRGTAYGVVVNPSGKTTVATQSGAVAVTAQDQTQMVQQAQYSLIVPGQPPTPPQPFTANVQLTVKQLTPLQKQDNKVSQVRLQAEMNPANAVWLNGNLINTKLDGSIDEALEVPDDQWISILVRTPLGMEQLYNLYVSPNPLDTPLRLGN